MKTLFRCDYLFSEILKNNTTSYNQVSDHDFQWGDHVLTPYDILECKTAQTTDSHVQSAMPSHRSFNCIFGKIGRIASEKVIVELLKMKCLPNLYYRLKPVH